MSKDCLDLEVNAHCANKGRGEGVVSVAEQEGSLSHTAVANDQDFEHVIKVLVNCIFLPLLVLSSSHLRKRKGICELRSILLHRVSGFIECGTTLQLSSRLISTGRLPIVSRRHIQCSSRKLLLNPILSVK